MDNNGFEMKGILCFTEARALVKDSKLLSTAVKFIVLFSLFQLKLQEALRKREKFTKEHEEVSYYPHHEQ